MVAEPRGDLLSIVDDFESGCDRMCLNINVEKNKVFVVRRKHRANIRVSMSNEYYKYW